MRNAWVLVLGLAAAAGGCRTSRFIEADAARHSIDQAQDAGADLDEYPALRVAKQSVDFAASAEKLAVNDLDQAHKDLDVAVKRQNDAMRRHQQKESEVAEIEGAIQAAQSRLDKKNERVNELRNSGLSEDEVAGAQGANQAIDRLRLKGLESSRTTLQKEIELSDLEVKDADIAVKAAQARMESADQRLRVARSLYQAAEQQAKVAEAEALQAKRMAINARLQQM
jgi:chromosome segregation ATPase